MVKIPPLELTIKEEVSYPEEENKSASNKIS